VLWLSKEERKKEREGGGGGGKKRDFFDTECRAAPTLYEWMIPLSPVGDIFCVTLGARGRRGGRKGEDRRGELSFRPQTIAHIPDGIPLLAFTNAAIKLVKEERGREEEGGEKRKRKKPPWSASSRGGGGGGVVFFFVWLGWGGGGGGGGGGEGGEGKRGLPWVDVRRM